MRLSKALILAFCSLLSTSAARIQEKEGNLVDLDVDQVWIKFNVKKGRDRTIWYSFGCHDLNGTPDIQGYTIKSAVPVRVETWSGYHQSDSKHIPDWTGPTNGGERKVGPYRVGSLCIHQIKQR
ncbi:hypothetical protein FQN57_004361 [Myotisia sp. PD_48]|nr:hypothetical protein FQN57_004361 [Myotisia sp. PD_48]